MSCSTVSCAENADFVIIMKIVGCLLELRPLCLATIPTYLVPIEYLYLIYDGNTTLQPKHVFNDLLAICVAACRSA